MSHDIIEIMKKLKMPTKKYRPPAIISQRDADVLIEKLGYLPKGWKINKPIPKLKD